MSLPLSAGTVRLITDGWTRPERDRERKKGLPAQNVLFGWALCCLGWGVESPEGSSLMSVQQGHSGDMVSGAWEWPAWDGFISAPLSCQSQPKRFHSSLTYVRFTSTKKAPKFRNQLSAGGRCHIFSVINNTTPSTVVLFFY